MTGYCSSLGLPISRASLRKFITRPSLCNNIQYITGVQHASRATNGEMIVLRVVSSPRWDLSGYEQKHFLATKDPLRKTMQKTLREYLRKQVCANTVQKVVFNNKIIIDLVFDRNALLSRFSYVPIHVLWRKLEKEITQDRKKWKEIGTVY